MANCDIKTIFPGMALLAPRQPYRAQSAFLDDLWNDASAAKRAVETAEQLYRADLASPRCLRR